MANWMVADCETDAFDGQKVIDFLWVLKHDNGEELGFYSKYSKANFVEYISEYEGICYFHNGGRFDILLLNEYISRGKIQIINGRIAKCKIGKCELRDSWLIIPEALGKSGLKSELDYSILNRDNKKLREKFKAEILEYAFNDVRALHALVSVFRDRFGNALTQAGAAWKEWVNMGGVDRHYSPAHDNIFRQYYYGGRCQAFNKGELEGEYKYLDVKSAYPFAMIEQHPLGQDTADSEAYFITDDLRYLIGGSFWNIRAISKGGLPWRDDKGYLQFPHDNIERNYFVTGWEIIAALETDTVKIIRAVGRVPLQTESMRPYVDKFYAEKLLYEQTGDTIRRGLAKRMLNSCYGKAATQPDNYRDYYLVNPGECVCGSELVGTCPACEYSLDQECDGYDLISKPSANKQYYDVALAASITGHARANLWRHINRARDVVYCDTDSIICKSYNDIDIGENIGQWEIAADIKKLFIAGKKLYAYETVDGKKKAVHKGFSKLDTVYDDVCAVARGEERIINSSAPTIKLDGTQLFLSRKMRKT